MSVLVWACVVVLLVVLVGCSNPVEPRAYIHPVALDTCPKPPLQP